MVLQEHPEIGRSVPEHRSPTIRQPDYNIYHVVFEVAAGGAVTEAQAVSSKAN